MEIYAQKQGSTSLKYTPELSVFRWNF